MDFYLSYKGYMYTKLTWYNYEFIEQIKESINPNQQLSALTLLLWSYYGYDIYFEYLKDEDIVLFYARANKQLKLIENDNIANQFIDKFFIIFIYFDDQKDNWTTLIPIALKALKANFKNQSLLVTSGIVYEDYLNDLLKFNHELVYTWYSNFIYETESLKYFRGKALQKKRNNLNFFIKNFKEDYEIIKYDSQIHLNKVCVFLKNWDIKNFINSKSMLVNSNCDLLSNTQNNPYFAGSILVKKVTNEIVGFTLVYIRPNIAEIIIEQTDRQIRGMYQYLLSQNLIINNVNNLLIDRQDGAWSDNISASKLSYQPKIITKRANILIKE